MGTIKYIKDGFKGRLIISNQNKKNAISFNMWQELSNYLDEISEDEKLRVLIIEGEGNNFSAGADVSEFSDIRVGEKRLQYDKAIYTAGRQLKELLIPTIAYVKGYCYGGGFALALKCDFRIAEKDVTFSLPAVKRGIGYHTKNIKDLVEVTGLNNTREILLTGKKIYYQEALEMGIITKNNNYEGNLLDYYVKIVTENAPLSIKAIKAGLLEVNGNHVDNALTENLIEECFSSDDYHEATKAFKEKRKPIFKGK